MDWTGSPVTAVLLDMTSKFKIEFLMSDLYPAYTPVTATYSVVLTSKPAAGTTVVVHVTSAPTRTYNSSLAFVGPNFGQYEAVQVTVNGAVTTDLIFDETNWNIAQIVTVLAIHDGVIDGGDAKAFTPLGGRINTIRGPLTIDGGIRVSNELSLEDPFRLPGETNYPVPDGTVTAAVTTNGLGQLTLTDSAATHLDPNVGGQEPGFDPHECDGQPLRLHHPERCGTRSRSQCAVRLRQHGDIHHGILPTGINPVTGLPYAINIGDQYYYAPVNPNAIVLEVNQVDVMNVFNQNSPSDDEGYLTEDRLYGFGMGPDTVIGGVTFHGGITYHNLEALNLYLGYGNDKLHIESTHLGTTTVDAGAGDDIIDIKTVSGHTTVLGGTGVDTFNVGSNNQMLNEIAALLTVDGGGNGDALNLNDAANMTVTTRVLTGTTLTGTDMPSLSEEQVVFVQAGSGTYKLDAGSFGIVTLHYTWTRAQVETALRLFFGSNGVDVREVRTANDVTYTIVWGEPWRDKISRTWSGATRPRVTWWPRMSTPPST